MRCGRSRSVWIILLVGLLALSGSANAQTDQPGWIDEIHEQLREAVTDHNAQTEGERTGFFSSWLVTNARVNLYVTGDDGTQAVYSFRVDDRLRISDLHQRQITNPTLRVTTKRTTLVRILASPERETAVRRAIRTGEIRVERVIQPLPGVTVSVGTGEAAVGAGGILLTTIVITKMGIEGFVTGIVVAIQKILSTVVMGLRTIWNSLASIATLLTILEQLELLDRIRNVIRLIIGEIHQRIAHLFGQSPPSQADERTTDDRRQ